MKNLFSSALMLFILSVFYFNSYAQTPEIIWTNRIPGLIDIYTITNILPLPNGGYIMGYTYDTVPNGLKFRILFLDKFGDVTSSFTYDSLGAFNHYLLYNISQTFNGGFILTGSKFDDLTQTEYTYLVKLNSSGTVAWQKTLTELLPGHHRGLKSIQTSEGFTVLSSGWNAPGLTGHAVLTRLDENGNYQGSQIYSQDFPLFPYDMVKTWDNRIVFVCNAGSPTNVTLYKVELNLSVAWIVPLNIGTLSIDPTCLISSINGGFLIGGWGISFTEMFYEVGALVKTHFNGLVVDYQAYGDSLTNTAFKIYSIVEQSDESVLSTGNLYKYPKDKMLLLKTNAQLDTVYMKILAEDMIGYSINKCKDGNIIVAGTTYHYPNQDTIYLVKIKSDIPSFTIGNEGLGIPIGDNQIVSNTISFPPPFSKYKNQLSSTLVGVDVMLDSITHTSTGDMEFTLSHNGVIDTLVFHAGGDGDDFTYTILSDQAQVPVNLSLPPFIGDYKPYSPLTKFDGMDATGEWTLSILDNVTGNTGMLHAWGLRFYFEGPVGVDDKTPGIISDYRLFQNYPNPFNPSTVISYQLPVSGNVTLKVYDLLGREIATLVDEYKPAGKYEVKFNAASHSGKVRNLPSGIYFYKLKAGEYTAVKKMILMK